MDDPRVLSAGVRALVRPSPAQVAHRAADIILEKKGSDLVVLDIQGCSDLADYMVIATGTNKRQIQAMAQEIATSLKREGIFKRSSSGEDLGRWVLLDLGDVLVHLMQEEARRYYDLEALWADGIVVRRGIEAGE
jgi:ribosome-associated protein